MSASVYDYRKRDHIGRAIGIRAIAAGSLPHLLAIERIWTPLRGYDQVQNAIKDTVVDNTRSSRVEWLHQGVGGWLEGSQVRRHRPAGFRSIREFDNQGTFKRVFTSHVVEID